MEESPRSSPSYALGGGVAGIDGVASEAEDHMLAEVDAALYAPMDVAVAFAVGLASLG